MYTFYINTVGHSKAITKTASTLSVLFSLGAELCQRFEKDPRHELLTLIIDDGKIHVRVECIDDIRKYLSKLEHAYTTVPR